MSTLYLGVMSGTSLDGVDLVLVDFANNRIQSKAHLALPMTRVLRDTFLSLNKAGYNELHEAALAANALADLYAQGVQILLAQANLSAKDIAAIGAHGQTVRHQPQMHDGLGYTLQINNPALLAERSGICVVADFRTRDLAAGGQGAPLVPAFHQHVFARPGETVAILNIGGMANISILREQDVQGFDIGPGNVLLDLWCQQHTGQTFDMDGQWAATGQLSQPLLEALLKEPFFNLAPPKSTGRDLFHADWLITHLNQFPPLPPADVQATLTALTAHSCAHEVMRHAPETTELLVCGGGAFNIVLMQRLQALLPKVKVQTTEHHGLPPMQVEAAAFAWLARQTMLHLPGNLPAVTGAKGPRVLGAIYPA
jgi:anhydro-N-acetylmuramic acid kinase